MIVTTSHICARCKQEFTPPKQPLTKPQSQVLDFLIGFTDEHGYAPSHEEICAHLGYSSLATANEHLQHLERKGHIKRNFGSPRAIEVLP